MLETSCRSLLNQSSLFLSMAISLPSAYRYSSHRAPQVLHSRQIGGGAPSSVNEEINEGAIINVERRGELLSHFGLHDLGGRKLFMPAHKMDTLLPYPEICPFFSLNSHPFLFNPPPPPPTLSPFSTPPPSPTPNPSPYSRQS